MLTIAGVGPGNPKYLTIEVYEKIKESQNIFGFGRVANSLKDIREDIITVNKVEEILDYLSNEEEILLLASGDPNFFGIVDYLKRKNIKIKQILPGLSSFQYLMAKLEEPWQAAKFISLHGRKESLNQVKENKLSIILIDKENNPSYISKELNRLGIIGVMYVGFNLSYDNEKIIKANIGEQIDNISSLGVVVIVNEMD